MVNQKSILLGTLISIILYFIIGWVSAYLLHIGIISKYAAGFISYPIIAVLLGALITGYMATTDYLEGAIHGSIVGIFTIVFWILFLMLESGASEKIAGLLIVLAVGFIGMSVLIGALGGFLGALINQYMGRTPFKSVTESEEVQKSESEIKEDKTEDKTKK